MRGFTLIEALVALVLFQIAALALAATSAVAARDLAAANRHARAHLLAQDRVGRLRPGACLGPASGSQEHPGGLTEHWRVSADGPIRSVTDSVSLVLPGQRTGSVVVRAWSWCGQ
jgi:Tfp pilus assembly protein PilV